MTNEQFEALEALVAVCEDVFVAPHEKNGGKHEDDKSVFNLRRFSDGKLTDEIVGGPITFGHVRRARKAIDMFKAPLSSGSPRFYLSNPPFDASLAERFGAAPSAGLFSEASIAAAKERISITFAGGATVDVPVDDDPLRGFTTGADADPEALVRVAMTFGADVDDEACEALEDLLEKRLPDLHSCGRSDLLVAILDDWLPDVLWRLPAPGDSRAVNDVIAERRRQVAVEGWTAEHDNVHSGGQLGQAALCYIWASLLGDAARDACDHPPPGAGDSKGWWGYRFMTAWPFGRAWFKPTTRRRDLVKGIALGLAELERLDRLAEAREEEGDA